MRWVAFQENSSIRYISISRNTDEASSKKFYHGHHFFLIELPICREESILDLKCSMSHSTACNIFPKMNQSVFSILKLGLTVLLWHMTFTKAFNFNMQLFFHVNTFLTYILSSLYLTQLGRNCYHGNMSALYGLNCLLRSI